MRKITTPAAPEPQGGPEYDVTAVRGAGTR